MPVDAPPAATFEVIQTKLFFCLTEAVFDRPAAERHAKNLPQGPAVPSRRTIGQEVFGFIRQHVTSYDQRALIADPLVRVSLSPTLRPAYFLHFTATVPIFDPIPLWRLFPKGGRVRGQVLNFAWLSFVRALPRVLLRSSRCILRRCFQDIRLH